MRSILPPCRFLVSWFCSWSGKVVSNSTLRMNGVPVEPIGGLRMSLQNPVRVLARIKSPLHSCSPSPQMLQEGTRHQDHAKGHQPVVCDRSCRWSSPTLRRL